MSEAPTDLTPVSAERDGRVLAGVGATVADLEKVMERHAETPNPAPEEPKPDTGGGDPSPSQQPKQTRGAKRFDQLTGEREAEKRRADAAEAELTKLKAELAQRAAAALPVASSPAAAEPSVSPAPAAPAAPSPTRAKPSEDDIGTKYQTYGEFVEDLADWKSEQRLAALDFDARIRQSIEADRASRSFADEVGQKLAKGRAVYPDFDAVLEHGPGAVVPMGTSAEQRDARIKAIMASPHSEYLLYTIAKDAVLAQGLAQMSDIEFGSALTRLVPTDPSVASPASTEGRVPVVAPAPYQPVGSGSKTTVLPSAALVQKAGYDFDKSGYRERRAAERGVRRR